ncbi:MAG: protein kinase domain-containing protein [Acidobacteriota bacterium]
MPPKFLANLVQALRNPSKEWGGTPNSPEPTSHSPKNKLGIGAVVAQRYRLDAELGRGGIGVVYRAHDIPNDRKVALKVINLSSKDAGAREMFLQEARITTHLHHPNIVALYETGMVETGVSYSSPFIAMEFIQGKSLSEMRGLTSSHIVDLGGQISDALDYIHTQGLVHGDLKPQNVIVEKRGYRYVAKLADFGLARPRGISILTMPGTVYYMAPEVIAGQPADVAADLYALGVLLYELVTGRVPFSNFDEQSILTQHMTEAVVPPSHSRLDMPPALESIILRLLVKDPRERFESAQQVRLALAQVATALRSTGAHGNLPTLPTRFVGRESEIAQVKHLLESSRLATLLGANGTGKTRLALAVGADLSAQFSDGVWLVEIAPWTDPALVPYAVASILGVHEEPHRTLMVSLAEFLHEKNLLLLLDQCEGLTGACAQLVGMILHTCPEISILATSCLPLNIVGEARFVVPPLWLPDSVQLLQDRLGMANAVLDVRATEPLLARACDRLGGIPFAIELAAAIAKEYPLETWVEHLEERLSVVPGEERSSDETLKAVLDWNYSLLNPHERVLFIRLSVFAGGFTPDAVANVLRTGNGEANTMLHEWTGKSLVDTCPSEENETRYRLLEPVREYASVQLHSAGEEEIARRNHRDSYLLLATLAEPDLRLDGHSQWSKKLEIEYANLLSALAWTIGRPQEVDTALRFGGALWRFWYGRGYWREGYDRLARIIALPHQASDAPARVQALIGAGYLATLQADYSTAQDWLETGLAGARDLNERRSTALALCGLGALAKIRAEYAPAAKYYREGWEAWRAAGDSWETANALLELGTVQMLQGHPSSAQTSLLASLDVFRAMGDKEKMVQGLDRLGLIACDRQQYDDATTFLEEALALTREMDDKSEMAQLLKRLGFVALYRGRSDQAHKSFIESLALVSEKNDRRSIAGILVGVAGALAMQSNYESAVELIGAAEVLLEAPIRAPVNWKGAPVESDSYLDKERGWVADRIQLNQEAFQAARARGRTMSLEQAIARAVNG